MLTSERIFPALAAGRLLLSLISLSDLFKYDNQLSSPLTSYHRLQEGIYLFQHDVDPYSGGSFYHSPLYLALFSTVLPTSRAVAAVLWTFADVVGAWALTRIWRARQRVPRSPRDSLLAALYLSNPYLLLSSLALSTSTFDNTLVLLSIMFASQGRASAALLSLAFLVQLSLSSVVLIAPILLLLVCDPISHLAAPRALPVGVLRKTVPHLAEFVAYSVALTLLSTLVTGSWNWMPKTWGVGLTLPDLTPNPGLWWYFFTEMFDHFRPFFLMVFSVHLIIYIAPICIKFQHDPLYAVFVLLGVLATFKAYPTLADPGLFLSMIALFPETYPYLRHPLVTALLHLHSSLLLPLFHHLWLAQGTGNANFFYASTLVFGVANGFALIDCVYAGLRIALGRAEEGVEIVQE
ncbi:hypothetical protein PLICRDRAFT_89199 [Plicaturopsis crispa FD-325 SS-3]|nr:hypothetical protein PLICRDRAFT_89199 [Plicaturopsis crispa FD-325 SS-3]